MLQICRRRVLRIVTLVAAGIASRATSALEVSSPPGDTVLVAGSTIELRGTAMPGTIHAEFEEDGGFKPFGPPVTVAGDGTWKLVGIVVPSGGRKWRISHNPPGPGQSKEMFMTGAPGLAVAPQQLVRFEWAGVDDVLKGIATDTLAAALTPAQLQSFVIGVKARTMQAFKRAYAGVPGIQFVEGNNAAAHVIRFEPSSDDFFGISPYDCGNVVGIQTSRVLVGTYRDIIRQRFDDPNPLVNWKPMERDDPLSTRIIDIGEALGRTAAHEFGHSLGLVGIAGKCGWMRGCAAGHNCSQFDENMSGLVDRFDSGFYIMDPGGQTTNFARLAEEGRVRGTQRRPAVFNRFSQSYLSIIHP